MAATLDDNKLHKPPRQLPHAEARDLCARSPTPGHTYPLPYVIKHNHTFLDLLDGSVDLRCGCQNTPNKPCAPSTGQSGNRTRADCCKASWRRRWATSHLAVCAARSCRRMCCSRSYPPVVFAHQSNQHASAETLTLSPSLRRVQLSIVMHHRHFLTIYNHDCDRSVEFDMFSVAFPFAAAYRKTITRLLAHSLAAANSSFAFAHASNRRRCAASASSPAWIAAAAVAAPFTQELICCARLTPARACSNASSNSDDRWCARLMTCSAVDNSRAQPAVMACARTRQHAAGTYRLWDVCQPRHVHAVAFRAVAGSQFVQEGHVARAIFQGVHHAGLVSGTRREETWERKQHTHTRGPLPCGTAPQRGWFRSPQSSCGSGWRTAFGIPHCSSSGPSQRTQWRCRRMWMCLALKRTHSTQHPMCEMYA